MKVTFKDVGQGDSIILEWEHEGVSKIGIIDCNKKYKKNPVVEYLETLELKEIEFIILSHPHSDHFSGMLELLNYIESKKIVINKFAHTLLLLGEDFYKYLKWVEIDTTALIDLKKVLEKVDTLKKNGEVKKWSPIIEGWREDLTNGVYLKCLSPSQEEGSIYMSIVKGKPEKNRKKASSGANYLSTLFCLVNGDRYLLLTSDSELVTFKRILDEKSHDELLKKSLYLGQMPHHGASKNYHRPFWEYITKAEERHAIASSGSNAKYNHPDFNVLKAFHLDGFRIHCTSLFHGSKQYLDFLKALARTSTQLDTFSTLIESYTEGDKVF